MANEMLYMRAEAWIDETLGRQEALVRRLTARRDRVIKAKMAGKPLEATAALAEAVGDLAWTMANCQLGGPVHVAEHLEAED